VKTLKLALAYLSLLVGSAILSSCALTAPEAFYLEAPEEWNKQQKVTAFFYALQKETTTPSPSGRSIRQDLVEVEKALYVAERILEDMRWLSENEEYVNYLLWTGSKQSFTETEGVWKYLVKCLRAYKIQSDLASVLGIKLEGISSSRRYNIRLITTCPELANNIRLLEPRIEEALRSGRLLPNQILRLELADPMGSVTLEATTYIVQPDSAQTEEEALNRFYSPGVYAEIKREGEEVPIVRLYRAPGSEYMNIVLVDLDLPDYFGYGLPDKMEMGSYKSALDYISAMARYLIPREESSTKLARKKLVPGPEDVFVVKSSEASFQVWEEGSFDLPVEYKDKDFISEVRLKKDQGDRKDGLKEVEFFIANYYTIDVVEYYTPKKEYSLVKDYSTYGNQITLQFKDKPTISSPPASLGVLTYVMFREADNKGWIYWDKDGDGVFDARRPIYWPSGGQSSGNSDEGGF
jgi:hypothetical protein